MLQKNCWIVAAELFQPCVAAALIPAGALAGYRNGAVYLRTSRYVPTRWEAVRDAMPALFDMLQHETDPSVRAVLPKSVVKPHGEFDFPLI